MDKINLKEILDGELIDAPMLNADESVEFATALTNALATRFQAYDGTDAEWDQITDNYLSYLMDNFSVEVIIMAATSALRIHKVSFNSETNTFSEFFEIVCPWIVGEPYKHKELDESLRQEPHTGGFGGNYTLKDHHKPEKNQ